MSFFFSFFLFFFPFFFPPWSPSLWLASWEAILDDKLNNENTGIISVDYLILLDTLIKVYGNLIVTVII